MALQLFDGSDSEVDDISKVEINEEFARRFEHNKRREDLQRLEELKKKGLISSSSSSDSDEESEASSEGDDDDHEEPKGSRREDKEFFDALIKVRKQDPSLKQKDVKLFESDYSSEEEGHSKGKMGKNPMYLKDVMAKHLIEEGPDFGDKDEESKGREKVKLENKKSKKADVMGSDFVHKDGIKTYSDEQEELKRAFIEAAEREGLEDEGDFFVVKEKASEAKEESDDVDFEKKLNEYFGGDIDENENSKFLKSYFMNKMWIDKNGENLAVDEEGDRVLGHARKVEDSVRKKTNARKEQRKSKEERMAITQKEREEELKHLKNLKKQEMQEKVKQIMKTAGINDDDIIPMSAAEIEEEFDPVEFDKMMKKAFDEKYYNAEDADSDFCSDNDDDMEKPDFEKEDELLGLPKDWDVCGDEEWKLNKRMRYELKKKTKELLHSGSLDNKKKDKKSRDDAGESTSSNKLVDNDKELPDESNVGTKSLSRKARRKQNLVHLKLADARRKAYFGQIPSKSKAKRKP
ncbi:protein KRI1-like protein [Senna tora]|uniref:Protein KRI1-like protein n=1 Tax=Senna tora TaxID=362788 RepID=A0A834X242_9FABA|nr:protein KRI1-like protein [Senna tora]